MDETDRTTMIHFARSNHFYSSRRYELTSAVATASDSRMDHPKSSSTITAAPTSGFFKFLARFSGEFRANLFTMHGLNIWVFRLKKNLWLIEIDSFGLQNESIHPQPRNETIFF